MKSELKIKRNEPDSSGLVIQIAIINWNGINDTTECIDSLLRMDNKVLFEAYILDNGSDNNEYEKLKVKYSKNPYIKILHSQNNLGFTHGNLLLYEKIKTTKESSPYIALLNNDTIVTENWLSSLYEFAEKGKWDIVSSKMIKYYDRLKIDNLGHDMLRSGEIIPMNHNEALNSTPRAISKKSNIQNFGACGGAAFYRISMLDKIGFFDPHFETGYEDAELGFRAFVSGYTLGISTESIVYHKGGVSIKKIFDTDYAIRVQRDILYTINKLYPTALKLLSNFSAKLRCITLKTLSYLFNKPNLRKIVINSRILYYANDHESIIKPANNQHNISSFKLYLSQKPNFYYNIIRVINYILLNGDSSLERYSNN